LATLVFLLVAPLSAWEVRFIALSALLKVLVEFVVMKIHP
jgi:hypothetical protein